jgi:hypothetical protein
MGRQSQVRHLAQVARSFRNGPGRSRRSGRPPRARIRVQVDRALVGTHGDHEHFELKIGLLRALRLACPETDVVVEDFEVNRELTEPVAVAVYDSTKTMRNRAVRVVKRSVEEGTWRAFARRSAEAAVPLMIDTRESADVPGSGFEVARYCIRPGSQAHVNRDAASLSECPRQ